MGVKNWCDDDIDVEMGVKNWCDDDIDVDDRCTS